MHQTVEVIDTPENRGMINKAYYLCASKKSSHTCAAPGRWTEAKIMALNSLETRRWQSEGR
jgi:hypothetical protein